MKGQPRPPSAFGFPKTKPVLINVTIFGVSLPNGPQVCSPQPFNAERPKPKPLPAGTAALPAPGAWQGRFPKCSFVPCLHHLPGPHLPAAVPLLVPSTNALKEGDKTLLLIPSFSRKGPEGLWYQPMAQNSKKATPLPSSLQGLSLWTREGTQI